MKRFLLVALLLVSAASVYAADLKVTGDMEVRGVMDNKSVDGDTTYGNSFFDMDLNLYPTLVVSENTTIFTKFTVDVEDVIDTANGIGTVPDSSAALDVERAYVSTKFFPGLVVNAGLMGGGKFASNFGDTETNVVRLQGVYSVDENISFTATYEKTAESNDDTLTTVGATPGTTTDVGDITNYILSAKIKLGAITVLPKINYKSDELTAEAYKQGAAAALNTGDYNPYSWSIDLGLNGDLGTLGFVFEGIYTATSYDGLTGATGKVKDKTEYGAYVDVFAKLDVATAGLAVIYESADKTDGVFSAGGDFDFTMVADDLAWGAGTGLAGFTAGKLYAADIKIIDKLTAGAAFAYGMATDKDATSDAKFWEVDANINYAIDATTTYIIAGGYANLDNGVAADPTAQYRVLQKFSVKF